MPQVSKSTGTPGVDGASGVCVGKGVALGAGVGLTVAVTDGVSVGLGVGVPVGEMAANCSTTIVGVSKPKVSVPICPPVTVDSI